MRTITRQLMTILATKIKLSLRSLRWGDDVVSAVSALLLVSLAAWSGMAFMLGSTISVTRPRFGLSQEVALWVAHVVSFFIFILWTFISVLTGFSFTRPLDFKALVRFPISVRTCVIADTLTQTIDWGVLLAAPLFLLVMQLLGLTSIHQILFSVILSYVFLNILILLSSLLRALVMKARPGLIQACSFIFLAALWLYVKARLAGIGYEAVDATLAADPVVLVLTHLPAGSFIEALHCLKAENPRGLLFHSLTLIMTVVVLASVCTGLLRKRDVATSLRGIRFHGLFTSWPDGLRMKAMLERWFPGIHPAILAFAVKDIVYFLRCKRVWVWSLLTYAAAFFLLGSLRPGLAGPLFLASIPVMGVLPLAMNYFAFEGRGFWMYLLVPASGKQVVQQKNMVITFLTTTLALPVLLCSGLAAGFNLGMVGIQLSTFAYHLSVMNIVGNCSSIWFANRVSFERVIGQFNPIESLPLVALAFAALEMPLAVLFFLMKGESASFLLVSVLLAILMCCGYGLLLHKPFPLLFERKKIELVRKYLVEEGLHDD